LRERERDVDALIDPANGSGVRLLVVAEDPLARSGLRTLIEDHGSVDVVGQISPGPSLEEDLRAYSPDAVLWDLGWNAERGLEILGEVDWADLPVVVLLADESLASAAWQAGARGLLPREVDGESIATALASALQGLAVVDPGMLSPLLPPDATSRRTLVDPLTTREMDVLRLMAEGLPNKAIAARLEISEFTVKFHVNAILGKLSAQSRTEAAMTAARMGLIPL
jgi:two-component system nitrate/nitrite response regulator NarL